MNKKFRKLDIEFLIVALIVAAVVVAILALTGQEPINLNTVP